MIAIHDWCGRLAKALERALAELHELREHINGTAP